MKRCKGAGIAPCLMACLLLLPFLQTPASADMVSEKQTALQGDLALMQREILAFMARDEVRRTLLDYGVDHPEVRCRLAALDEDRIRLLHARIAQEPGGGGFLDALITVVDIFTVLEIGIAKTE